MMVKPKKHLGQHFLTDKNIANKIVGCLPEFPVVCELGPGTGVLTTPLLERETIKELNLIEIDNESVEYLNNNYSDSRLKIINHDFLKLDISNITTDNFALIGNFPYNISSQIFFRVIKLRNQIPVVVGMIQKEVAERIAAPFGNKTYGILSVLLQTWYDIEYCFTVNESVFNPPPKVKSAVIRLKRNHKQNLNCNEKLFIQTVKAAFNHRRKTLRNSLKPLIADISKADHKFFSMRAEQLSSENFIELTNIIDELKQ